MNIFKNWTAVTHDGMFHADDVCAAVLIQKLGAAKVIRDRRLAEEISSAGHRTRHLVFDAGGCYDPGCHLFDHHQTAGPLRPDGGKYSSFGMLFERYGFDLFMKKVDAPTAVLLVKQMDEFVQEIDRIDNGEGERHPSSFSSIISSFNPTWEEQAGLDEEEKKALFDRAFDRACEYARETLDQITRQAVARINARAAVLSCDLVFEDQVAVLRVGAPWQEVMTTEEVFENTKFVIFESPTGTWMCQCVPPALGSFEKKLPLPETWAGKKGEELVKVTKVADCRFCHPGRFICGAASKEGALALAEAALNF
jgi:uncharacterized UPF0160 family protein